MTGHTADDQAETILINLLRGSGTRGLAGMQPTSQRPLLQIRRSETQALCSALGIAVFNDPSNNDERFQRNRIRHEVLPLLESLSKRDLVPVLMRQADLLRDDDDLLNELADALDPTDALALASAPLALARRAIRAWLTNVCLKLHVEIPLLVTLDLVAKFAGAISSYELLSQKPPNK
jgi:tRNA(Ile)-lysidine synthase